MTLYHVSFGLQEIEKLFTPKVPESCATIHGEDTETPRICFSLSIAKCIQATECLPAVGEPITVYKLEVEPNDGNLMSPNDLYSSGKVPDALENQEYWYLKEVSLIGEHRIITYQDYEFSFAWTVIKMQDVIKIVQSIVDTNFLDVDLNVFVSEKDANAIYRTFCQWLDRNGFYSLEDELYDMVSELPWAQLKVFNRLDTVNYNGARFGFVAIDKKPHIAFSNSVMNAAQATGIVSNQFLLYDYKEQVFCRSLADGLHWFRCDNLKEVNEPRKLKI